MPKILDRLTRQLQAKGNSSPRSMATALLQKHGVLKKGTTTLTANGNVRNKMTPSARAKSRAGAESGRPPAEYTYSARTNRATLRKR